MITEATRRRWKRQLSAVQTAAECDMLDLSDWEVDFVESVEKLLNEDKDLSFKQSCKLGRIYDRAE